MCRDCKKVLDYLAISEVIETMEDLVQFVKDLSPCLSKVSHFFLFFFSSLFFLFFIHLLLFFYFFQVSHDVEGRRKDLLNPYQRDILGQHLDQVKTLAPILICSMKIFIQILGTDAQGISNNRITHVKSKLP